MKYKKILDIAIDIETLSLRPTAAILSIAARPFLLVPEFEEFDGFDPFFRVIDASSCAMYGFDFSQGTVKWWSEQSDEAKKPFLEGGSVPIKDALFELNQAFEHWKSVSEADAVRVWMQGADFDGPILKNAYITVFGEKRLKGEIEAMPWKHDEVRDSRTFILEHMRVFHPEADNPYSVIPPVKNSVKHDAYGDMMTLINNVLFCEKEKWQMFERMNRIVNNE